MTRSRLSVPALAVLLAAAGCDSANGPLTGPLFSNDIPFSEFQHQAAAGPTRVRITLQPTGLTAVRVKIKRASELTRPERIDSRITAISTSGADGTVTLELGGLVVGFNSATTFRAEDEDDDDDGEHHDGEHVTATGVLDDGGDHDGHGITAAAFVSQVQAALAAGRHPEIEARRAAPATPQAPGDAQFMASALRLDEGRDAPRIEMNVTDANVSVNSSPPPDGWIQVLGLKIELRVTEGITKLVANTEETEGEQDFAGVVSSVDLTAKTATLADGTILRIVLGTRFENEHDGMEAGLASLADVKAALDAGKTVNARGEGLLETATPRTFDVIEVRFRIGT